MRFKIPVNLKSYCMYREALFLYTFVEDFVRGRGSIRNNIRNVVHSFKYSAHRCVDLR